MRIDAFRSEQEFKQNMDNWINRFRSSTPAEGHEQVLIPGDPERETSHYREQNGLPLIAPVVVSLNELPLKFDLAVPEPIE